MRVHHRHARNEFWSTRDAMSFSVCSSESLPGAFSRSFVMPANAAGRGSFGNPAGGGRRWLEFRIVFESAGLFHGQVTNAGSRCPETMKWLCIASRPQGFTRMRGDLGGWAKQLVT